MKFDAYTYALNPVDPRQGMLIQFERLPELRGSAVVEALRSPTRPRVFSTKGRASFAIMGVEAISPDRYWAGELGKSKRTKLGELDAEHDRFSERVEEDWVRAEFIVDATNQVIFVAGAREISSSPARISSLFESAVNPYTKARYGHLVDVNPITARSGHIWDRIRESDEIVSLRFELVAPNLWWLRNSSTEMAEAAKDALNAVHTAIEVSNPHGHLVVDRHDPTLKDWVSHAESGEGKWRATVRRNGQKRALRSDECVDSFEVSAPQVASTSASGQISLVGEDADAASIAVQLSERFEREPYWTGDQSEDADGGNS